MTAGDEDGDDTAGSDSEPSEDNLSEDEMAKIIPIKKKNDSSKVKDKNSLARKASAKRLEDKTPSARAKQPPILPKANLNRSPVKRIL